MEVTQDKIHYTKPTTTELTVTIQIQQYVAVSSYGHGVISIDCGQLSGVSLGLNFLFTLDKLITWNEVKWKKSS